jgi:hypothetical protein
MSTWTPKQTWQDVKNGQHYDVRPVWSIAGPAPFGGLVCTDDQHAADVCDALNRTDGLVKAIAAAWSEAQEAEDARGMFDILETLARSTRP